MKKNIHPEYFTDAKIKCSCGAVYTIGMTIKEAQVELCSACHPFYTGKQKIVDKFGRVDKFKARMASAQKFQGAKKGKKGDDDDTKDDKKKSTKVSEKGETKKKETDEKKSKKNEEESK